MWAWLLRKLDSLLCCLVGVVLIQMGMSREDPAPGEPQQAFIFTLITTGVFFLLSTFFKPKIQTERLQPAGLGDFQFPTATEARHVPLIWGTVRVKGPNVVWYGDLSQTAITEKVKTGLFSSETTVTGYRYRVGIQMTICRGPIDSVERLWIGDEVVFDAGLTGAGVISVNEPNLFGGDEEGTGGFVGDFRVHIGDELQAASAYLSSFQKEPASTGDTPAYRGTAYAVLENGYVGNSPRIETMEFEVRRIPNGLGLTGGQELVNSNDANLANVAYELLTNDEWGFKVPVSRINVSNFQAAAATLATEGNGFSMQLDNPIDADQLKQTLERQMDGVIVEDRLTGQWVIRLARAAQTPVASFDDTNIIAVTSFSYGAWADTSNQTRVRYSSRVKDYKETYAVAQDMGNFSIQGKNVNVDEQYPGVKDDDLANSIVWRDLRVLGRPLAKASLVVNRDALTVNPGELVNFTNSELGITTLEMRVLSVDIGSLTDSGIKLELIEDVFSFAAGSFVSPKASGFVAPSQTMVDIPSANRIVFEAPKAFIDRDPASPGVANRIFASSRSTGNGETKFDMLVSSIVEGTVVGFMVAGEFSAAVGRASTAPIDLDADLESQATLLSASPTVTNNDIGVSLANVCYANGEFIGFTSAAAQGAQVRLSGIVRGLLDSVPVDHAQNDVFYMIFVAGNVSSGVFTSSPVSMKLIPQSNLDTLAEGSATAFNVTMANRHLKPYPPVRPNAAGSGPYPTGTVSLDGSNTSGPDDGVGFDVTFTRRDFRTPNEYLAQLNETSLPGDFPSANSTIYRVAVTDDPAGTPTLLYTTDFNSGTATVPISRTRILGANAGVVPSRLLLEVKTRHTVDGVNYDADNDLAFEVDVSSTNLTGATNMGVVAANVSTSNYTVATAGVHTVTVGTVLPGGNVQESINGGGFTNLSFTGNTANLNGGVALSISDTVALRHTETQSGFETIIVLDDAAATGAHEGYAVLQV